MFSFTPEPALGFYARFVLTRSDDILFILLCYRLFFNVELQTDGKDIVDIIISHGQNALHDINAQINCD